MSNLVHNVVSLLTDPKHTRWIAPLLIVSEAALSYLIVNYVPYTEIDYSTYLAQVHHYLQHGERNYAKLTGPTGSLVYPGMHVWIYSALYHLTTTRNSVGEITHINVPRAQIVFAGLYLVTLAVVIACYRRVNAPPWLLVPLVLSKRLHSIFMLRLFNDAWATFFLWFAIYAMQRKQWVVSAFIWAFGVGVKMTILLAAPAMGVILLQTMDPPEAVLLGVLSFAIQILVGIPFLEAVKGGDFVMYFKRAFQFDRTFLFKWTVNWRFIGEDRFLSKEFAGGLAVLHLSLLATFVHTRWVRISSSGIGDFVRWCMKRLSIVERQKIEKQVTPTFVMDAMLGSMLVGLLCARSLHYQFYAYIGWATPYLLWRGTGSLMLTLTIWAAQEWSWLVFPSTDTSSMVVVGCLALQVVSALIAQPVEGIAPPTVALDMVQERTEKSKE